MKAMRMFFKISQFNFSLKGTPMKIFSSMFILFTLIFAGAARSEDNSIVALDCIKTTDGDGKQLKGDDIAEFNFLVDMNRKTAEVTYRTGDKKILPVTVSPRTILLTDVKDLLDDVEDAEFKMKIDYQIDRTTLDFFQSVEFRSLDLEFSSSGFCKITKAKVPEVKF